MGRSAQPRGQELELGGDDARRPTEADVRVVAPGEVRRDLAEVAGPVEEDVDDRGQPQDQEQAAGEQDRRAPAGRCGPVAPDVQRHADEREPDGGADRRREADVGLYHDRRRDREADQVTEPPGGHQEREEQHEHEPDQRHVQVPRLADHPLPDAEVGHADDRRRGQEHAQAGPGGRPREPCHRDELEHRAADVRGPRRLAERRGDRRDEPEHRGAGVVPPGPAEQAGERWVRGPDVANAQVDDREVVDRVPRPAGQHHDGDNRRCHDRRRDEPAERLPPPFGPRHDPELRTEGSRGRPSVRSPTTLRWISFVPAQIELAW